MSTPNTTITSQQIHSCEPRDEHSVVDVIIPGAAAFNIYTTIITVTFGIFAALGSVTTLLSGALLFVPIPLIAAKIALGVSAVSMVITAIAVGSLVLALLNKKSIDRMVADFRGQLACANNRIMHTENLLRLQRLLLDQLRNAATRVVEENESLRADTREPDPQLEDMTRSRNEALRTASVSLTGNGELTSPLPQEEHTETCTAEQPNPMSAGQAPQR